MVTVIEAPVALTVVSDRPGRRAFGCSMAKGCFEKPRVSAWAAHISLVELERRYQRLPGRTGAVCTEEFARAHGALLFNRSTP
jgi:hypothetical protein